MRGCTRRAATSSNRVRPTAATQNRRNPGSTIRRAFHGKHSSPPAKAPTMATAAVRGLRAWPSPKPAASPKPPRNRLARRLQRPPERAMDRPFNVLFLCTGNSARSILAEAILNREGCGNFRAFSAGSQPKGQVHPYTLDLLRTLNFDVSALRSKSWTEFSGANAAPLDFVFTVCDNAAGEACPYWPRQPMTAHWGVPDPAAATGNEAQIRLAFADTFRMLSNRIALFVSLPLRSLDKLTLQRQLDSIGTSKDSAA